MPPPARTPIAEPTKPAAALSIRKPANLRLGRSERAEDTYSDRRCVTAIENEL